MTAPSSSSRVVRAEFHRWGRDPVILLVFVLLVVASAVLTFLAVSVAASGASSAGNGVSIETDMVLDSETTADDFASMARSTLTMLVPIAAIVLGVRFAGSEMTSGALLQLAVAARRLRLLFCLRALTVVSLAAAIAAAAALGTLAAADLSASGATELAHLSGWDQGGHIVAGSVAQSVVIGLVAFGLSALTRRWIVVTIAMIIYLVGLEPALSGLLDDRSDWLPRAATSELMETAPDLTHVVPTVIFAVVLAIAAVVSLKRDRASR